jgi:hypothetical protein
MGKVGRHFVAVTGAGADPDLMLLMEIIGKDAVIQRLDTALIYLVVCYDESLFNTVFRIFDFVGK